MAQTDRLVAQTPGEQAVLMEGPHGASGLRGKDEGRSPNLGEFWE